MLEKQIEERVCAYARVYGFLAYKFTSPQRRAVPDRMFVTPDGEVFFIEFKAPGKKATPPQLREHDRLIANHIKVYVIDDVATGQEIIRGHVQRGSLV